MRWMRVLDYCSEILNSEFKGVISWVFKFPPGFPGETGEPDLALAGHGKAKNTTSRLRRQNA
jgi:hypothetical protein